MLMAATCGELVTSWATVVALGAGAIDRSAVAIWLEALATTASSTSWVPTGLAAPEKSQPNVAARGIRASTGADGLCQNWLDATDHPAGSTVGGTGEPAAATSAGHNAPSGTIPLTGKACRSSATRTSAVSAATLHR